MGRNSAKAGYRELGAALREKRLAAGLTLKQIGHRCAWSETKIFRIESGEQELDAVDLVWYAGMLGLFADKAAPLIDLCRLAIKDRGYWLSNHGQWVPDTLSSLIYHETTATGVTTYEPLVVPGYLRRSAMPER